MIRTVLFDLDGTILDTNELILRSFLHVLQGKTPKPLTREDIIPHMGGTLAEQMRYFSGREEVDDLIAGYREYNLAKHDELVREFPHVTEVLSQLKDRGIRLGVVTSKLRFTADLGLRHCNLDRWMDVVITADDVENPKPAPDPILLALRRLGEKPETAMMVGDSHFDLLAAKRAGVVSVAVAWSLKGTDVLRRYEPDFIINDMRELLDLTGPSKPSGDPKETG